MTDTHTSLRDDTFLIRIRTGVTSDQHWIAEVIRERWADTRVVARGVAYDVLTLHALIAEQAGRRCGLLTYVFHPDCCEIVTLYALLQYSGVGSALVTRIAELTRESGLPRLLVVTTNDNLEALRFYQRRGFSISTVRPNAQEQHRLLKPSIPLVGAHRIPIRDEIELVTVV
ncbi:MAG: GNAT family N-acetyltransferase [Phycisphaerae bacterium]|nr:GNAT family N-acetyltransferase [Phycisphaerae bacterium]